MTLARETIPKLPKLPQAQYSLQEQLEELRMAAIRLGLYDADQWLAIRIYDSRASCPRLTPGCTKTGCSPAPGHSCSGPDAPRHVDMGL